MVQSLYICRHCKKQFRIKDAHTYKTLFYVFLWLCIFVTIFVVSMPLLVVTVPIAYYFYKKYKELKGKKFFCPFCKREMERTVMEEKGTIDF
jgi:hypothetical protein